MPAHHSVQHAPGQDAPSDATGALGAEIDALKAMMELMREPLGDVKEQRDGWHKQAET